MNPIRALQLTDRDIIKSIVNSCYILDYGLVSKVNADKTVDVIHAKIPVLVGGKVLQQIETKGLEVLTVAGGGFSFVFDIKKGDKVLLLGLKNYIKSVGDVDSATETKTALHYSRETMKVFPLCVFNDEAKVTVEVGDGTMKLSTEKKVEINGNTKQFVTWGELNDALQDLWTKIKSHTHPASSGTTSASVELSTVVLDISDAKTTSVVTGG